MHDALHRKADPDARASGVARAAPEAGHGRSLVQRRAAGPRSDASAASRASADGSSTAEGPAGARAAGLIVEDGPAGPGQMLASVFREQASAGSRDAVDRHLGPTAMFGVPAVDQLLAAMTMPGSDVERLVRDFAPQARDADSAQALVDGLLAAVRQRVGEVSGPVRGGGRIEDGAAGAGETAPAPGSLAALPPIMQRLLPDVQQVLRELDALIAKATWKDLRPEVVERASVESRLHAAQRRTGQIPDLTGIGGVASVDAVAADIRRLQAGWPTMPVGERMERILDAVNHALVAADVPAAKAVKGSRRKSIASFNYPAWELWLSAGALVESGPGSPEVTPETLPTLPADGRPLDEARAAELASTTAHEARHGEEWFLGARFAASQGKDAATIAVEHRLPGDIAEEAARRRLDGVSPQVRELAESMNQATAVERSANAATAKQDGDPEMNARRDEARVARDALRASVSSSNLAAARDALDRLRQAIAYVEERYLAYRGIPYEADGHEVGDAAQLAFRLSP